MSDFSALPPSIPDAIFGIAAAAKAAGPEAIDGTIGIYLDEDGKPLLLESTRRALEDASKNLLARSYSYPPLLGLPECRQSIEKLIFGDDSPKLASIAATGGTGAVALNLRLAQLMGGNTVILPTPAWPNHRNLTKGAGVKTVEVKYLHDGKPTLDGIVSALEKEQSSCIVLLQGGCHNPTGLDLSESQWGELVDILQKKNAIAILDFAYQGFSKGIAEDAFSARLFAKSSVPTLVAWSASKNHSIYGERVGMACAIVPDEKTKKEVETHYMTITRSLHSAAAAFGQSIVARVQQAHRDVWLKDLEQVRNTLTQKRELLGKYLPQDLQESTHGHGMFAMLPLSKNDIEKLRTEHQVFLTDDGRINIAGIPLKRMEELCEKIHAVHSA